MTAQHGLEQGLRDWLRDQEAAPAYMAEVFQVTSQTRQRGPSFTTRLADGLRERLPAANTRATRIALVGLLLAAMVGVALVVGAIIRVREQEQSVVINPAPSTVPAPVVSREELIAIVRGGYGRMPELPPLVLTAIVDGSAVRRISVSQAGDVRVEHYASIEAAEPTDVLIYSGESIGQLLHIDGEPYWYGSSGISEDPRVFVYAALSGPGFADRTGQRCPSGTVGVDEFASTGWTYVGREEVAGRAVHHVTCEGGHLWIDTENSLVLRSRGPTIGIDGRPTAETNEIEVVDLDFVIPPEELFVLAPPDGVKTASDEQHAVAECYRYGWCLETPRAVVLPPPADVPAAELTAAEIVAAALEGGGIDGPYTVRTTSDSTGRKRLPNATVVMSDGKNRSRREDTGEIGAIWETTYFSLVVDGSRYQGEEQADGSLRWSGPQPDFGPANPYPIDAAAVSCDARWALVGTDLVAGRPADHVTCRGDDGATELWIDRELSVVLRMQTPDPWTDGVDIQQVDELTLGPVDPGWFDVPEDVESGAQ